MSAQAAVDFVKDNNSVSLDSRYVILPCDRDKWSIVYNTLIWIRDIPCQSSVELIRRLDYLYQCSLSGASSSSRNNNCRRNNQPLIWDSKRIIKRSPFLHLASFIDSCMTRSEKVNLLDSTIPFIADKASEIEKVKPTKLLSYLRQNQSDEVELSRPFVASLIASMFLCIMPESSAELCQSLCPSFKRLFQSLEYNDSCQDDKLKSIFNYFNQLKVIEIRLDSLSSASSRSSSYSGASGAAKPSGSEAEATTGNKVICVVNVSEERTDNSSNMPINIIPSESGEDKVEDVALNHCNVLRVQRRVLNCLLNCRLLHCYQPLIFMQINKCGQIFQAENKLMRVISAESYLNNNIDRPCMKNGKTAGAFTQYPELLSQLAFVEPLEDNEALWIEGYRQFSSNPDNHREPEFPPRLCLADPLPVKLCPQEQYSERNILREINKLYAGFLQTEDSPYLNEGYYVERNENLKNDFNHRMHRFAEELAGSTIEEGIFEASRFHNRPSRLPPDYNSGNQAGAMSSPWSFLRSNNQLSHATLQSSNLRRGSHNIRGSRPSLVSSFSTSSSSGCSRRFSGSSARSNSIYNNSSSSSSRRSSSVSRKSWDLGLPIPSSSSSSSSSCSNCGAAYMIGPSGEHLPYMSGAQRGSDVALEHHDTIFEETEDVEGSSGGGSHSASAKHSVGSQYGHVKSSDETELVLGASSDSKPPLTRQFRIESDAGLLHRFQISNQLDNRLSDTSTAVPMDSSTRNQLAVLLQAPISDSRKWSLSRDLSPNRYQQDEGSSSNRYSPLDLGQMLTHSYQELSQRSTSPYPPYSPSSQIFLGNFTRRNSSPNICLYKPPLPPNPNQDNQAKPQSDTPTRSMTRRRSMPTNIRMARFLPISDSAKMNWKSPDYLNIKTQYLSKDDFKQSYSSTIASDQTHSPRIESALYGELQSWSDRFISDVFNDATDQAIKQLNSLFDQVTSNILQDSLIMSSNQLRMSSLFSFQADNISSDVMESVIDKCHNLHHWAANFIDDAVCDGLQEAVERITSQSLDDEDEEISDSVPKGFQDPDLASLEGQLRKSDSELDAGSLTKLFPNEEDKINSRGASLALLNPLSSEAGKVMSSFERRIFQFVDSLTTTTVKEATTEVSTAEIPSNFDAFADNFTCGIIVDVISQFHKQSASSSNSSRVPSPKNISTCANCTKKLILAEQQPQGIQPMCGVASGNWGCHSDWAGDSQLKAMLQWIAASVARVPVLLYYTEQDPQLVELEEIVSQMIISDWTVRDLFFVLQEYRIYLENINRTSSLTDQTINKNTSELLTLFEFLIYKL